MIRAFTGPSRLSPAQKRWVANWVASLPPADEIRTGMADDVDTIAALVSLRTLPDAAHVLYRPHAQHNDQWNASAAVKSGIVIINCPKGDGATESYRIRNNMMVKGADELIAFVWSPQFYRSGEWMTINIAKKYSIKTDLLVIPSEGVCSE